MCMSEADWGFRREKKKRTNKIPLYDANNPEHVKRGVVYVNVSEYRDYWINVKTENKS